MAVALPSAVLGKGALSPPGRKDLNEARAEPVAATLHSKNSPATSFRAERFLPIGSGRRNGMSPLS